MNKPWSETEEIELIKLVKAGISSDEIAMKFGRSSSAIDLRIKKIIYDNIEKGISVLNLAKFLNLTSDKILGYYHSFKQRKAFEDNKEKSVKQYTPIQNLANTPIKGELSQNKSNKSERSDKKEIMPIFQNMVSQKSEPKSENLNNKPGYEDILLRGIDFNKMKMQNDMMKIMLENVVLKKKIKKYIKSGKFNSSMTFILEKIRKGEKL